MPTLLASCPPGAQSRMEPRQVHVLCGCRLVFRIVFQILKYRGLKTAEKNGLKRVQHYKKWCKKIKLKNRKPMPIKTDADADADADFSKPIRSDADPKTEKPMPMPMPIFLKIENRCIPNHSFIT
jgi:hypothetical protein